VAIPRRKTQQTAFQNGEKVPEWARSPDPETFLRNYHAAEHGTLPRSVRRRGVELLIADSEQFHRIKREVREEMDDE
jgi:hypothetical protein